MDLIDPFIWQLVIVPILTIGTGVLIALRFEKAYIAPLITLVLNLAIEMTMGLAYYGTLAIVIVAMMLSFGADEGAA